jgi:hypothetical protein
MATKWIKLTGETATMFDEQYGAMLEEHADEFDAAAFPEEMFVRYLLDIRKKSLEMKRVNLDLPEGPPDAK